MNVKIRNKFIEIKYSVSNGLVIFITNFWWSKAAIGELQHPTTGTHSDGSSG